MSPFLLDVEDVMTKQKMQEINFTLGEGVKTVRINGDVHTVRMSDAGVTLEWDEISKGIDAFKAESAGRSTEISKMDDEKEKEAAIREHAMGEFAESANFIRRISAFVDKMVGDGSADKFFNIGKPVSLDERAQVTGMIVGGIMNEYYGDLDEKYGLDEDEK